MAEDRMGQMCSPEDLRDENYPAVDKAFMQSTRDIFKAADPIAAPVWRDMIVDYVNEHKDKITEEQLNDLLNLAYDMELIIFSNDVKENESWEEEKNTQ